MNKEFIPYTEALALKELGFDEDCFAIWSGIDELNFSITDTIRLYSSEFRINGTQSSKFYINDSNSLRVAAPTYSQAFRWFRKNFGLFSSEVYDRGLDNGKLPIIHSYSFRILNLNNFKDFYGDTFKTYEEAELECLKKLIEIVKQK
jgi:hypothetical protein